MTCATTLARRPTSSLLLATLLFVSSACTQPRTSFEFEFVATWNGEVIQCGSEPTQVSDLRFFVSDVVVTDAAGREHGLDLTAGDWQQENVALIDLENGEGACRNGTQEIHTVLSGTSTADEVAGVRFTVGVPFEQNHANPLLADAPLDDAAMHWHWRSGYKFLRAGVEAADDSFWIHLGSTRCEGTVQNISGCKSPNRVTVILPEFSPEVDRIEVRLSELFRGIELDDGMRSDCSSGPAEANCVAPFAALGLPFGDGPVTPQTVFGTLR
jgi:uncharacterized repeat protein (TIGR04052 family)